MPIDRKQAIREYKERIPERGVYAMRCTTTGKAWVESSMNLGASRNGAFHMLRAGDHRDKSLQAEFNTHGEAAFEFEILETLPDDVAHINLRDLLKQRKLHWIAGLDASAIQ